jgi:tol-pal system protein YbgF
MSFVRSMAGIAMAFATTACFATRNDVRILQGDILASRAEAARLDSLRARQLVAMAASIGNTLAVVSDSLKDLSGKLVRFQGETRQELNAIAEQLLSLAEATGMSQQRLSELRAELEQRNRQMTVPTPVPAPGDTTTPAVPAPPSEGPYQLYQIGREQLTQKSFAAARDAFTMLLQQYPNAEEGLLANALASIGDAYAAEQRYTEADSAFQSVVTRYPRTPAAPNALYKLGLSLARQGKRAEARTTMDNVVREYPRTDAATLALDWLRNNR